MLEHPLVSQDIVVVKCSKSCLNSFCAISQRRGRCSKLCEFRSHRLFFPLLHVFLYLFSKKNFCYFLKSLSPLHPEVFIARPPNERTISGRISWVNQPVLFSSEPRTFGKRRRLSWFLYIRMQSTLDGLRWLCITEVRRYLSPLSVS